MEVNIITAPSIFSITTFWNSQFRSALESFGDTWHESHNLDNSDVHMFLGLRHQLSIEAIAKKKRCLIIERAYLGDRINKWQSLGFNGLNGRADFRNRDVEPDRWQKYWKEQMQPWNPDGDYALLIGQMRGDAALRGTDQYLWAQSIATELKQKYGKVVYRRHPACRRNTTIDGCYTDRGSLSDSLKGAKVVVTYNSNVGVDAIMAGKPVIAYDRGSMVYDIASHNIEEDVIMPDREDWGRKIAYAQWLPEEAKEAWSHLRRGVG